MKRVFLIAAVLLVMNVLTGCNLTISSTENLIKPPKLSEQQSLIYEALREQKGDNITLVYPRTGDYLSSFIIENLDEEETNEAIVFYKESSSKDSSGAVRMIIFDQIDGRWQVVRDITTDNLNEVEKVSFIRRGEHVYIVIGFSALSSNTPEDKQLMIYEYVTGNGQPDLVPVAEPLSCMNFEVFDFDGDEEKEIVVLTCKTEGSDALQQIQATLYQIEQGSLEPMARTDMDSEQVIGYAGIYKGRLSGGTPALYFDTIKATDQYGTEILIYQNGRLQNCTVRHGLAQDTVRAQGLPVSMFGEEGVYYIPRKAAMPGYDISDPQFYWLEWYRFNEESAELEKRFTTYTNYNLGYGLVIPERWEDSVTAKRDASKNEIRFFNKKDDKLENEQETLLVMQVLPRSSNTSRPFGMNIHKNLGQLDYAYRIHVTRTENDISDDEFGEMFYLLSDFMIE